MQYEKKKKHELRAHIPYMPLLATLKKENEKGFATSRSNRLVPCNMKWEKKYMNRVYPPPCYVERERKGFPSLPFEF